MLKAIFVDMDNTLIETQVLYDAANKAMVDYICGFGDFAPQDVLSHMQNHQVSLFPTLGYSAQLVPQAYEDTLLYYVPDATGAQVSAVRDFAKMIFEQEAALKAGVEAAIASLAQHYPIYLVTVGDQTIQQSRVDVLPFKNVFSGVFIVDHKNADAYKQVLQIVGIEAKDAVMIGDSLTSDILPSLETGMNAIYIPAHNWAAREIGNASLPEKGVTVHVNFVEATEALVKMKAAPKPRQPRKPNGPKLL